MRQRHPARRRASRGLRSGTGRVAGRRYPGLLPTLLGSIGRKNEGRPSAEKALRGAFELVLAVIVGAAVGIALVLGYVPEAL